MWFNNLVVYQFNTPIEKNADEMEQALEELRLKPCPPHARQSQGWIAPLDEEKGRVYSINGCHLMVAAKEVRLLPSSIIQAVLEEKNNAFELNHNRPMRRAEILQLKEEIEFDLLPKAFSVQKKDWFYIDTSKQWLVINSANPNKASEVVTLLTKTLGSLVASPLMPDSDLSTLFARWLHEPTSLPEGLVLAKSCVLVTSGEDQSQYTCKDIKENSEELAALLAQGYTVSSIELIWQERVQFILTNNFLIKRLKCLDYLEDAFKDNGKLDDEQEQFDANFSLLTGELRDLLSFLMDKCRKKETVVVPEEACAII
jgi:recombination associated protein RdgC